MKKISGYEKIISHMKIFFLVPLYYLENRVRKILKWEQNRKQKRPFSPHLFPLQFSYLSSKKKQLKQYYRNKIVNKTSLMS